MTPTPAIRSSVVTAKIKFLVDRGGVVLKDTGAIVKILMRKEKQLVTVDHYGRTKWKQHDDLSTKPF